MTKPILYATLLTALACLNCNDGGVENKNPAVDGFMKLFSRENSPGDDAYTLTTNASPQDGGTVSRNPDKASYAFGEPVTVTATPENGYIFAGWSGAATGTTNPVVVTMDGNKALTVGFGLPGATRFTVYFNGNGTTGGSAPTPVSADSGKSIKLPDQQTMEKGGYGLGGWNTKSDGTGTGYSAGMSYTVTGDVTLYAVWTVVTYTLTVNRNPTSGGTTTPASSQTNISAGTQVSISTTAASGYTFGNWTISGSGTLGNANSVSTTVTVNGNVAVTANFQPVQYTLTTYVSPPGGGSVSRSPNQTSYANGTDVTLTATATNGNEFTWWSGALTSTSANITITMNDNKTLTANFKTPFAYGTYNDNRDGKNYNTIKIDTQTWMAENLNYVTDSSWCYDNADSNCVKYGRLYNWSAAMKVCPSGWHLPSRAEWQTLVRAVDLSGSLDHGNVAGKKLKSTSGWLGNGNGTNEFGFSALPGGFYADDGSFANAGYAGDWWTASDVDVGWVPDPETIGSVYTWRMVYNNDDVWEYDYTPKRGIDLSVRCVGN
jgi:uncharacterized protein (TIGR02145 family)/uncharacterized repeat protein (TIGR02543 family)